MVYEVNLESFLCYFSQMRHFTYSANNCCSQVTLFMCLTYNSSELSEQAFERLSSTACAQLPLSPAE